MRRRFRSKKNLQDDYSISRNTVDRLIAFMRDHKERYSPEDFLYIGGRLRVSEEAFYDAIQLRESIKRGIA